MGRKKIKKSEKVERLVTYVKKKHKERVLEAVNKEVDKIKLEELLEKDGIKSIQLPDDFDVSQSSGGSLSDLAKGLYPKK